MTSTWRWACPSGPATVESTDVPADFDTIKNQLNQALHGAVVFKAKYLRDLRDELLTLIHTATEEFNLIFGRNIFARKLKSANLFWCSWLTNASSGRHGDVSWFWLVPPWRSAAYAGP
jgi:hypothetical protein